MTEQSSKWQIEKTVEGKEIKWLPFLTLTFNFAPKRIIGITDKDEWISQWSNGNIVVIDSREKCYDILICLEKNRNEFESLLKEAITKYELDPGLSNTFPTIELIKFSLQSHTSWSTNAIFWLREEDIDKEFEEIITNIINDKYFSQHSRHQAFRVLKNWQNHETNSNASC